MTESMTSNWFATIAIFAWPVVAIVLYRTRSFSEATLWTILGALLLLPSNYSIKLAMIPAFDKNSIPNLCVLIGCIVLGERQRRIRSGFGVAEIFAIMYIVGPVFTSAYNNDDIVIGDVVLPGVGYYDGVSALLGQLIFLLPFFIARRYLQKSSDSEAILRALVIGGLFYSLPMLFEIRMSPVLSNWIYGFSQLGMSAEMRYGGFRPVVFMKNGITAAFFMTTAFLASVALWRVKTSLKRLPPAGITIYLGVVIVLCKSAGALVYAIVVGIFVRWITPKVQLGLAVVLVSVGLLYPVLRATDNIPEKSLIDAAALFSQQRAASLKTRFDSERQLLARASERLVFGWGRYGRSRVYDENSGKDMSPTDGAWLQTLGQFGIVGFVAQFGLLALPVFRALSAFKYAGSVRDRVFLAALSLIVALGLFEQLPNSSISPWSWLLAGALMGRAEALRIIARPLPKPRLEPENPMKRSAGLGTYS